MILDYIDIINFIIYIKILKNKKLFLSLQKME